MNLKESSLLAFIMWLHPCLLHHQSGSSSSFSFAYWMLGLCLKSWYSIELPSLSLFLGVFFQPKEYSSCGSQAPCWHARDLTWGRNAEVVTG